MPEYVLNKNFVLRSKLGLSVEFIKGKPTYVPPSIEREAAAVGAEPVEGDKPDLTGEPPPVPVVNETDAERKERLKRVIVALIEENNSANFTGQGRPNARALQTAMGYEVTKQERDVAWEEVMGERAAAQDQAERDAKAAVEAAKG